MPEKLSEKTGYTREFIEILNVNKMASGEIPPKTVITTIDEEGNPIFKEDHPKDMEVNDE